VPWKGEYRKKDNEEKKKYTVVKGSGSTGGTHGVFRLLSCI
jgi:hypothetical protein